MSIANHMKEYLSEHGVDYQLADHASAPSSMRLAEAAHVKGECMAKGVLLEDEQGLLLAVVPATHRVQMGELRRQLQHPVGLATEEAASQAFADCTPGAVPVIGAAYGMRTLVDESLCGQHDVYLDAGDHCGMLRVSGDAFDRLVASQRRPSFSRHV